MKYKKLPFQDLTPNVTYDYQAGELIEQFYDLIFEEQLSGWWTEKNDWPAKRDLAMFQKWFDVEFHSALHSVIVGFYHIISLRGC